MAEKKKLTTEEILALARKQKADPSATPPEGASAAADSAAGGAASEKPAAEASPAKPAAAPKSTAEILAAARAQKAVGGAAEQKPAAAAPKSTADILAAARAQKAGGGAPAGAAPAAASSGKSAKSASGAVSPAAPAGNRPGLQDMVAAVKAAQSGAPVVAPRPGAARAAVPGKPKLPGKAKGESLSRRAALPFLLTLAITPFALAWTALAGVAVLWSLGMARFMMPNMVLELPSRFKVGPPSDFPPGTVSEKYKASRGIYLVNTDAYDGQQIIVALASICTHLGCTPNWLEGEQKFKCPCHGSGFYISGINFEGPAPRPLERVGLRRADDGMLEVDKSVKFQEELGQWSDPKSFYAVT